MTARAALGSFVVAVAVCLASAPAWAVTNKLYLNSQPGDWVGQGQQVTYTDGVFYANGGTETIQVSFSTDTPNHWWYLWFSAPRGQVLGPGMYEAAQEWPFQSPTHPGLSVYGDGRGCGPLMGRFLVLDVSYAANGDIQSFAADFEQHCEGAAPALYGAIRINSNLPIAPRLSIGDAAVIEGPSQTPMTFTISLAQPASNRVTVHYATANGTAIAGHDFVAAAGAVTFAPGETSKQITVKVLNDNAAEGDQHFYVYLGSPRGAVLASKRAKGTIIDGDGPQTFLVLNSQPGDPVGQGQSQRLTILDGAFSADQTVHVHFDGGAWWDLHFAAPGDALLVPGMYEGASAWPWQSPIRPGLGVSGSSGGCGALTGRFVVLEASYSPNGDVQSFAADFEQHCDGAVPALYGAIRFNSTLPVAPRLSVGDAAVIEGPSPTPMTFTISLSEPASGPVTVDYTTADGTALAGSDYVTTSGTVTFAPSETSKQIPVQVLNDGAAQGDQYFYVNLGNPNGAILGSSPGKGTIYDSDGPQTFLILNSQPGDYVGLGQSQKLTTLDGVFGADSSVHVRFHGDTWWDLYFTAPGNGTVVPGTYEDVRRGPYQSPTHPGLNVYNDRRGCNTLTGRFVVLDATYSPNGDVLSFAADFEQHCEGAVPALYGAIRFNSTLPVVPRLSVSDAAVIEGSSPTPMTFTISLSEPVLGPVTVDYATADGTALAASDYVSISGTVTFAPGETSKPITVQVLNDGAAQGDQYFYVNLGNANGAILGASPGTGTIIDSDGPQTFLVLNSQPGDPIGQGQSQTLTILDGVFSVSSNVHVYFDGDTAWDLYFTAPGNRTVVPGTYEGARRWPFRSPTHPGLSVETYGRSCGTITGRFVVLEASYAPSGELRAFAADFEQHCDGAVPALYGAIRFNSTLPVVPQLSVSDAAVIEGLSPTPMTFTISLSEPVLGPVTVDYATADGTAQAGSDYVSTSGTVTFAPSETSKQITVQALNDGAPQGDQYFYVNLGNPNGAILGSSPGTGTIYDGDGPQTFLILNSQPGDYVGLGQSQKLTILDGVFSADSTVQVQFAGDTWWQLVFRAPGGTPLVPGMYGGATRWPFESPTHPGLYVAGGSQGCNTLIGRFLVLEAKYAPNGSVQNFAADFEQHCEGATPALYGSIRFNSSLPVVPLLSVGDAAVIEGPSQTPMTFTISLSEPAPGPVTVDYATTDGTAVAGSDYVATFGSVAFTPPETSKQVVVPVLNDGAAQGDQYFYMNLGNPIGATIASGQGKGTIVDSEDPQSYLFLNSQPGDSIGQGQLQKLTIFDGVFEANRSFNQGVHIGFSGDTWWDAYFAAPGGAVLVPGTYEGAVDVWLLSQDHPGLDVSGNGSGCTANGRFVVLEAVYGAAGEVQRFAANFEQHCGGQTPALFGAVRFNSRAGPSADLATSVVSAPSEVNLGQPLTYSFAVTNNGPDPVTGATATFSSSRALAGLTWSCSTTGGATCGSGGVGAPVDSMNVPAGGTVTYVVDVPQTTQAGPMMASLCAAAPGGIVDWNGANDCVSTTTVVLSGLRGDFDGDGFSDILWQKAPTRELSVWYMKDATLQAAAAVPPPMAGWSLVGTGDFSRDGLADILLRQDSTGCLAAWYGGGYALTVPPRCDPQWEVAGVGDFDGDRKPDVLWRNRVSGALSVWLMDGMVRRTEVAPGLGRRALSWRVAAVADLDGDGQADLVMQRPDDNRIFVCFLKGLNLVSQAFVSPAPPAGYRLAAAADYDGDGRDDLLWQNQRTGELRIWYMNGSVVKDTAVTTPATHPGTGWKVVGPR